jgi:hypothetical protein
MVMGIIVRFDYENVNGKKNSTLSSRIVGVKEF